MPGCRWTSARLVPAWLVYMSSPRVQPPSWPGSSAGGGAVVVVVGYAAPVAVTATASRLTLQPSPAAQLMVIRLAPACRCTERVAVPQSSQLAVGANVTDPASAPSTETLSVRLAVAPLA